MTRPPNRFTSDAKSIAEAAFKAATTRPVEQIQQKTPGVTIPGAKDTVSIRLDRDVLEHFQQDGPGWQDRINTALRKAAGLEA